MFNINWSFITTWLKPAPPWRGYFCPLLLSLFSTLPIRREITEFLYQSGVKEAFAMVGNLYACFRFKYDIFRKKIIPFEAVNRKNNSAWQYKWSKLDSARQRNCVFTDRMCLPWAKFRTGSAELAWNRHSYIFQCSAVYISKWDTQGKAEYTSCFIWTL